MENCTIAFSLEEQEEKRNILVRIRLKYGYNSEEAVFHYLNSIYPNPAIMDYGEKKFIFQLMVALLILLEEQIDPYHLNIVRDRYWKRCIS